jgi:hypothetical protein
MAVVMTVVVFVRVSTDATDTIVCDTEDIHRWRSFVLVVTLRVHAVGALPLPIRLRGVFIVGVIPLIALWDALGSVGVLSCGTPWSLVVASATPESLFAARGLEFHLGKWRQP